MQETTSLKPPDSCSCFKLLPFIIEVSRLAGTSVSVRPSPGGPTSCDSLVIKIMQVTMSPSLRHNLFQIHIAWDTASDNSVWCDGGSLKKKKKKPGEEERGEEEDTTSSSELSVRCVTLSQRFRFVSLLNENYQLYYRCSAHLVNVSDMIKHVNKHINNCLLSVCESPSLQLQSD